MKSVKKGEYERTLFSGYFLLNILQQWRKCVVYIDVFMTYENPTPTTREAPTCKPHNKEHIPTINARRSRHVNEKNNKNAKNVNIVNARRSGA
jgi:hypothetical protein